MIEKLTIKNLQSHRKTVLEFAPGINVIVGKSQSGKTAILRAFYWLFFNRPSGLKIRTQGNERPIRVNAIVDGKSVTLAKGKTAKYSLDDQEWKGFNRKVPEQIETLLNIDEINIQKQLDEHFLITSSPQEIARVINQITGLEKMDKWVKELTSTVNSISMKKGILSEQKNKIKKKLAVLDDIDVLDSIYEKAEKLSKKILKEKNKYVKLTNIRINRDKVNKKLHNINMTLRTEDDITAAIDLNNYIEETKEKLNLLEYYNETKNDVDVLSDADVYISDCIEKAKQIEMKSEKKKNELELIKSIDRIIQKIFSLEVAHKNMLKTYTKLLEESGECPTCFSPVSKIMLNRIIKKL